MRSLQRRVVGSDDPSWLGICQPSTVPFSSWNQCPKCHLVDVDVTYISLSISVVEVPTHTNMYILYKYIIVKVYFPNILENVSFAIFLSWMGVRFRSHKIYR